MKTDKKNPLEHPISGGAFSPMEQDNLHRLDNDEIQILRECVPFLQRVCDKKFSRNAVARMLAYISFENKEFSSQVMKDLLAKISNCDFEQIQYHKRPLMQMVLLEDENVQERLKKAMSTLLDCLKTEASYYKYCDAIVSMLHKIVLKSPLAANIFYQFQSSTLRNVE